MVVKVDLRKGCHEVSREETEGESKGRSPGGTVEGWGSVTSSTQFAVSASRAFRKFQEEDKDLFSTKGRFDGTLFYWQF